jgi:hypothetical protein
VLPAAGAGESLRLDSATNLNALARTRHPEDIVARNEYRRLMALANPSIFAGKLRVGSAHLRAGTVLVVPPDLPPITGSASAMAPAPPAGSFALAVESRPGPGNPGSNLK